MGLWKGAGASVGCRPGPGAFGLAHASSSSDCASCSCLSRQGPGATSLLSDDSVTSLALVGSHTFSRYIHSVYVCLSPLAVYLKLLQHC